MRIASISHKTLERLWIDGESRGLPADQVKRITAALTLLSAVADMRTLATVPGWRLMS
jgi:plasmid maintenance system killer protein